MTRRISAIITDDELSGRDSIRTLLARHPRVEVVAECGTGPETVRAVEDLQPDLLFLDVQLPGRSGIEVLEQLRDEALPVVIFVTAYDEYALRAFDANAADYLLKPYSDERFHVAVSRAQQRLEQDSFDRLRRGVLALAEQAGGGGTDLRARRGAGYLERLTVPTPTGMAIVRVDEIGWVDAAGDYACLHAGGRTFVVRFTMKGLERRLDPSTFVRIHRSTIVNVNFMRELRGSPSGEYVAVLRDGASRAISGRGRELLARALDVRL